ncbi:MAG: hypothetical protein KDK37_19360, partial [Leptospiraceae bacterium]|nr:hypothetical protein [Leptospiraceae bacterium]
MDIKKTISNSAWPVLYLVAGLLFLSFYPFYPSTYFYGFFLILLLFGAISFLRPVIAGSLMIAGGSLFGNHPGGRFLELFDLALLLCLAGLLRPVPPKMRHREANDTAKHTAGTGHSAIGVRAVDLILPGVLLITILSYSGAFYLLEAFEGYKFWPFHF